MRYSNTIDQRMFDFRNFYDNIALKLPNDCTIVEVGVANGASAIYLAEALQLLDKKFKLLMVDNMDYGKYDQMNTIWRHVASSGLFDSIEIIPKDSIEASKMFNGDSLDFVFLDSSHEYEATKLEIVAWYPKLKDDAILAGHDAISHAGVSKAIKEVLPEILKRPSINEEDHKQDFNEKQFLFIENTSSGFGVWHITKNFWWQPVLPKIEKQWI